MERAQLTTRLTPTRHQRHETVPGTPGQPDQVWVGLISYLRTWEG